MTERLCRIQGSWLFDSRITTAAVQSTEDTPANASASFEIACVLIKGPLKMTLTCSVGARMLLADD